MGSTGDAPKGAWKVSEERFFYEYLRVAGDRSVEDCCRDISGTLGSKTVEHVLAFYQKTLQWLTKGKETSGMTNKKMHGILIKFYDTFVAPKRTQKKQDSIEELSGVDRVSPAADTKEASRSNPQQVGSENYHIKEHAGGSIPANLRAAQCVEILLVPFDENLANSIASSGCDPCPRLRFNPSQKIVGIIDQLRNSWDVALRHLGKGGVRLKAPEDGPVALKPLSWGDPIRDRELTLLDLMVALQVSSPSTLGYVWESYTPSSIPTVIYTNHMEKKPRASPQEDGRKSLIDILNSDSLPAFSPKSKGKTSPIRSPKQQPGRNQVFEFVEQKRIPIGLNRLLGSETMEKEKGAKRHNKRVVPDYQPNEVPPGKILKNGWMQYTGAMQQIQNYNLMQGKYCPSHLPVKRSSKLPIQYSAFDPSKSIADSKGDSMNGVLQNQDFKARLSIAEAPRTTPELSSPQKMPPTSTPQANMKEDLHLNLASLSPPSSFKLPSEFHRLGDPNSSPIRTLKGIFDSCYPTESPDNNKNGQDIQREQEHKKEGTEPLIEGCSLSALDVIHPTTSILSFLDGLSNSKWMGMADTDHAAKTDAQQDVAAEKRPFAKLFDK